MGRIQIAASSYVVVSAARLWERLEWIGTAKPARSSNPEGQLTTPGQITFPHAPAIHLIS
jgi:hypothetical protein